MRIMRSLSSGALTAAIVLGATIASAPPAAAHCDTLGGPVIATAELALEKSDVTPVLKWVKPDKEAEIKAAFSKALAVRKLSPEATEMADTYFFETLVRIHREGEGAPYTGLKPAGAVEPAVAMADKALESGSVDQLAGAISKHAAEGIRERFVKAYEARKHADESVQSGREFVEAYVQFTHYVERLHLDATTGVDHHSEPEGQPAPAHQH
ncbi:MAG TPA: DUF6448 family protein [Longimicrobiales bacterium]|nr:DUF6448 family protein [Longimicrobiales bacterium]